MLSHSPWRKIRQGQKTYTASTFVNVFVWRALGSIDHRQVDGEILITHIFAGVSKSRVAQIEIEGRFALKRGARSVAKTADNETLREI